MTAPPRILILGAGPAGLGAALWLARRGFDPLVVEARDAVGGNAGSFRLHGLPVDYGSHRLHPATDPEILAELRSLLGPDLLVRPRRGRIFLGGRWIRFPLQPLDLALRAPPAFLLGTARDLLERLLPGSWSRTSTSGPGNPESFASVLEAGLGRTICREFYFPYARKIWGLEPEEISPTQAARRVEAGSMARLLRRLLPGGLGAGGPGSRGVFYYPREGFGQISEGLRDAALAAGARLRLGSPVRKVAWGLSGGKIEVEGPGGPESLEYDHLWSTIPLAALARRLTPPPPSRILEGAEGLESRAMILVYLVLGTHRFTVYDAHYFPGPGFPFTRVSEPRNYSGRKDPPGVTVLCAEMPCSPEEFMWEEPEEQLGKRVVRGLGRAGLRVDAPLLEVAVRRLSSAYPLYRMGWEKPFGALDRWLDGVPKLLTFGRQGLFAHDNTHHALFMARAAVECLADDGGFDGGTWAAYRERFATHVVED